MKHLARFFPITSAVFVLVLCSTIQLFSQGSTTAAIRGAVTDKSGHGLVGASVVAIHVPSGTQYGGSAREDGTYNLANMKVGGPYTLKVSYVGYSKQEQTGIFLQLSQTLAFDFQLAEEAIQGSEVVVRGERSPVFNSERTGASTAVTRQTLETLPTITRRIADFIRLTPQAIGLSFAGQDNRLNDITVDGSFFNNSFGLGNAPGDRTGVSPISLDAIEQVQVHIAPYDLRQGHFIGAAVNTVTKSGSNELSGSVYYNYRHQGLVGTQARDFTFNPGTFNFNLMGIRLSGPIIENKVFLFASFEQDKITQPGTTFLANPGGGVPATGSMTRVLASDLDALSTLLRNSFGYDPGSYQGYDFKTPATRFTGKVDWNIDEQNKASVRYTYLDSDTDVLLSNSSSLGAGTRRTNNNGLNFSGSNYKILENIRSIVGEWNSLLSRDMANNLIVGYTSNDESRGDVGQLFPFVDILNSGTVYTSFGSEPFTPNNELRYSSIQFQDNFTWYVGPGHTLSAGVSAEKYHSENVFFPGKQSAYVYNSLADFNTDAAGYLANPSRTVAPITLNRFQVRYSNIPGQEKPIQPLDVLYAGAYVQDQWQFSKDLRLTFGIRFDVPSFDPTGYANTQADTMTFKDENGSSVKYKTDKLPNSNLQISPRLGFNWDALGDRTTQVRGGTGLFSGPPLYVWISNQIGNTGVLTGFLNVQSTTAYPFNPNPDKYKPTTVTGAPASSYELALTDPDFKFPQLWRSNIAVDQKLPFDLAGTVEFLYTKDVNGIYYIDASLKAPDSVFTGADNRPRWGRYSSSSAQASGRRYYGSIVQDAVVLKNESEGYSWNIAASLERPLSEGLYAKAGYSYGESRNTVDPGSIAFGSWSSNAQRSNPNTPGVGLSSYSPGNRLFATASYRFDYFDMGATTVTLFCEAKNNLWNGFATNYSYTLTGDLNNDGISNNDLVYIPRDRSEMSFQQYTQTVTGVGTRTFTAQEQSDAWDGFITQDPYLSKHRGEYAVRNAAFAPFVYRADLSIIQEVYTEFMGKRNSLQLRADFLNITNLINKNWGVGQRPVNNAQPLATGTPAVDAATGNALYRMRTKPGTNDLMNETFEYTNFIGDVFQIQIGLRYTFN
jgi:hypothetical protein